MTNNLYFKISRRKEFISINSFIVLDSNKSKKYVGDILGTINNNDLEIYVYVSKDFREQGISKLLFSELFNYLKEPENIDIDTVSLKVEPNELIDRYWLIDYYKKLGFKEINNKMIYEL